MNLLKMNYWTNANPGSLESVALKGFLFVIGVLFLCLITTSILNFRMKKGIYKRIITNINTFFSVNFFISLYLLFVTYEEAYILAMRFWFILWLLSMLIWIYFIFKDYKKVPDIKKRREEEEQYRKYIP